MPSGAAAPGWDDSSSSTVGGSGQVGRLQPVHRFTFTIMAEHVSSVAYALEAALAALDGELALLVPTIGVAMRSRPRATTA